MGLCGKLQADIGMKTSAKNFHKLIQKTPHHISNASGDKVQGCELHEGDWGEVGSIVCWKFFHDGKAKVGKDIIEAVDEEKNSITFRVIEGDLLEHYKTFKYTIQAIPKDKGCVVHWTLEYEKQHENIPHSCSLLELCVGISKDIDAHLMKGN